MPRGRGLEVKPMINVCGLLKVLKKELDHEKSENRKKGLHFILNVSNRLFGSQTYPSPHNKLLHTSLSAFKNVK